MSGPLDPAPKGNGDGDGHAGTDREAEDRLRAYWAEVEERRKQREANGDDSVVTTTAIGNPRVRSKGERPVGKAVFRVLADVAARDYEWFWTGRIPVGEPVLFFGDCDQGKSMLSVSLAATVTTGGCWPDRPGQPVGRGSAVFIQDEDTLDTTLRPRVEAAGGDPSRVHALDHILYPGAHQEDFSLARHLKELQEGLEALPDAKLLVIDPVSAYLGGADEHNNAEVRAILRPLGRVARRLGIAVVLITHVNKGSGVKANYRVMGSGAFVNAPRAAFLVCTDPEDPDRRLVAPSKFNLGPKPPGLAYRFAGRSIRWETEVIPGLTANAVLARERALLVRAEGEARRGPVSRKIRDATLFILTRLDAGEAKLADLRREAEAKGIATSTFFHGLNRLKTAGEVVEGQDDSGNKLIRKGPSLFPPATSGEAPA